MALPSRLEQMTSNSACVLRDPLPRRHWRGALHGRCSIEDDQRVLPADPHGKDAGFGRDRRGTRAALARGPAGCGDLLLHLVVERADGHAADDVVQRLTRPLDGVQFLVFEDDIGGTGAVFTRLVGDGPDLQLGRQRIIDLLQRLLDCFDVPRGPSCPPRDLGRRCMGSVRRQALSLSRTAGDTSGGELLGIRAPSFIRGSAMRDLLSVR